MMFILKFILYFIVSFAILSFPVSNKTIFTHLNNMAAPLAKEIFQKFETGIRRSSNWSKKIFTNSTPDKKDNTSIAKKKGVGKDLAKESYTPEERELLEKILKQN